jgi:hypothetical protein
MTHRPIFAAAILACLTAPALAQQSVARQWDEQILAAIRIDTPRPPVHARNLYHVSAAMYDAWAAYSPTAAQVFHPEHLTAAGDVEAARAEAISYAAYRMIRYRYQNAPNHNTTFAALDAKMAALGYNVNVTTTVGDTPAALGNRIFNTVKALTLNDGSNEPGNYAINNGYAPVNFAQPVFYTSRWNTYPFPNIGFPPDYGPLPDPNRWQPLFLDEYFYQNGLPAGSNLQTAVCPHWGAVTPFALNGPHPNNVYLDPGPQARLGTATDADYKATFVEVIRRSSYLTTADGVMMDIGPATHHNNPLGTNDGTGYGTNPVTGQPYALNSVLRGDYTRVLAQFWADGPHSETPPGHWNVIANNASDSPLMVKRIGGVGPIVNNLEWDVKLYLALNGSVHDAAIACWGAKGYYDSSRPITAIRFMGASGQSTTPGTGQGYNVNGLPLIPDLIERTTTASVAVGGRHAVIGDFYEDINGEPTDRTIGAGKIVVKGWRGRGTNTTNGFNANPKGVDWIEASRWLPYQAETFVTPAFPGYYSGHSTFSRAAAEVLSAFTGSEYFPGGFASYTLPANFLQPLENGPAAPISLQWAKYYDAADEAGISRTYGGIHPPMDDVAGRTRGHIIGPLAYQKALKYFTPCPADVGGTGGVHGGDGHLDNNDFVVFIDYFFARDARADLGVQGGIPGSDGNWDFNDVVSFIDHFFNGC